jgi:hypothetical protein
MRDARAVATRRATSLKSTRIEVSASIDSKALTRTTTLLKPNELHKKIAQVYLE